MWDFGLQLEEDTAEYTGDFAGIIKQAPAAYRLLTQLLEDPDVPSEKRTGLLAAVAYFILPHDAIPEETHGPLGYLDDLYVTAVMVEEVRKGAGDPVVERNWELETPVVPFLERVIERAEEYFEDSETRVEIFEYLGYAGLEERIVPSS